MERKKALFANELLLQEKFLIWGEVGDIECFCYLKSELFQKAKSKSSNSSAISSLPKHYRIYR